jgi:hypothetical protein
LLAELREAGASHGGGVDLSARGGAHGDAEALGLGRTEWVAMQASADAMRGLVRIKISDDNDIKAARCALETCRDFFDSLEQLAQLRGRAAFEVMQSL